MEIVRPGEIPGGIFTRGMSYTPSEIDAISRRKLAAESYHYRAPAIAGTGRGCGVPAYRKSRSRKLRDADF